MNDISIQEFEVPNGHNKLSASFDQFLRNLTNVCVRQGGEGGR